MSGATLRNSFSTAEVVRGAVDENGVPEGIDIVLMGENDTRKGRIKQGSFILKVSFKSLSLGKTGTNILT